ncbi:hypothetical protein B0H14DRAFT_2583880 [Mycena olivaceomarginata]|nr:hypothetical protein B0H14DRAFT_2583880 [Mycena olivaceomarginata]
MDSEEDRALGNLRKQRGRKRGRGSRRRGRMWWMESLRDRDDGTLQARVGVTFPGYGWERTQAQQLQTMRCWLDYMWNGPRPGHGRADGQRRWICSGRRCGACRFRCATRQRGGWSTATRQAGLSNNLAAYFEALWAPVQHLEVVEEPKRARTARDTDSDDERDDDDGNDGIDAEEEEQEGEDEQEGSTGQLSEQEEPDDH